MADGENESPAAPTPYEEAMEALSSMINQRTRGTKTTIQFDLLFDYLKILELEDALDGLKIVHVAGTKGKGSTCTFTESILRNCGFRTGLFTSPHLIDVRERFRLDGVDISQEKFLAHFWWCFNRLKERTTEDLPMPPLFRFLTLLAFKIFAAEQVDVAIMEVGLGGRFDATNVVQKPVVCGITSLGYDHMEILGYTLGEIAGEKAGIIKRGIPAFTVQQPDEAMCVLEDEASSLNVDLQVVQPLDVNLLNGLKLGLEGEHQYVNAGLAIALSFTWLRRTGHLELANQEHAGSLPEQFIKGLTAATFQGRAQIVPDQYVDSENDGDLVFYLDGAHSPESMEICAKWFSGAVKGENQPDKVKPQVSSSTHQLKKDIMQVFDPSSAERVQLEILLFNCMSVRDPELLLPPLMKTCASQDVHFKKALFVPNVSVYHKVGTHNLTSSTVSEPNLSWQLTLQRAWDNSMQNDKGREAKQVDHVPEEKNDDSGKSGGSESSSVVFSSLPLAIKWLRDTVRQNQSVSLQVLVTGSLHLVGDVLKLTRK
ncbi:unnamed protein product [Linum tenue]|uniref:Folylpolyglutamate synthase n=1 Tax=Linum tenue TaxID=586396 RepID=A0AAV0M9E9_9ROSI|nr:unnamed protein product [Linum tenue]